MTYLLNKADRRIVGEITLAGSKSISNRVLIIRALTGQPAAVTHLANARDTQLLEKLLAEEGPVRDAGAAGTTFRFLTAYLSLQGGVQTLTGTERMKQRPIGVLVEAMRGLGADIEYLEKEGYPPLRIGEPSGIGQQGRGRLKISAGTSSQYISALLMIGPTLPNGLELELEGRIVSRPYIEMTLNIMRYFGVDHSWEGQVIRVPRQAYQARPYRVEADWSAASYYYAMAAFADELELQLNGLFEDSVQGDAVLAEMMAGFGIRTEFNEQGVRLTKSGKPLPALFEYDFLRCPDLAQTLFVVCAGTGVQGLFTGLETLYIKETNRIAAMQTELAKVHSYLSKLPPRFSKKSDKEHFMLEGKAMVKDTPTFDTYEDHRMAMALAPLAMFGEIKIAEPMVVVKSYPDFYEDMERLGFVVKK